EKLLQEAQAELAPLASARDAVHIMKGDVSDEASCAQVMRHAEQVFPHLMILVNNAGVYGPKGAIEEVNWTEWVQAVQINLFGTVLMCRQVIPFFRRRGYGKIINLSGGGATAPLPRI